MLELPAYITLIVITICFLLLVFTRLATDMVLMAGVAVLLLSQVLTPEEALAGFSNQGMIIVGVLFVVAHGVSRTGGAGLIIQGLLGRPNGIALAQLRLMLPVASLSSVVNNTPIVAMLIPAVNDWAKRNNISVSQLMMPLSYAAIVGGACSLIGTSTNLVINDMLQHSDDNFGLAFFELAWVGIPCVIVTIAYIVICSRWLLPKRSECFKKRYEDARQYTVEMSVESVAALPGLTVESAGLRSLPGLYLIEVERAGHLITAVGPDQLLEDGDRLVFAGDVESVVDLQRIRGLRPADDQIFKVGSARSNRHLVEVVVSNAFPKLGQTVKEGRFRSVYDAAIIAVAREGQRIQQRIGDIQLKPGDTLLMEAPPSFERQQRYSKDFLLVRRIESYQPIRHEKMTTALAIFASMIVLVTFSIVGMLEASFLAVGAMLATRCIRIDEARKSVDWQVLIIIAASIALGLAMEKTGLASAAAHELIAMVSGSPTAALAMFFVVTALLTALVTNIASAVVLFPIAAASSAELGVNMAPYAVTLMVAASASFATPIGYQTNLMVYGPGEYRFTDFLKVGIPLTFIIGVTTVLLVPVIWPFYS